MREIKLVQDQSEALKKAHDYILKHQDSVIKQSFRNQYHVMPEVGWLNDPNGFSIFNEEYHLFYQYYPYDIKWGPMHWGHVTSKDLVKWNYQPVALAPDQSYDQNGCFSGSAIQVGDKHVLLYTGHVDPSMSFTGAGAENVGEIRQVQCLAIGDGVTYQKAVNNPVIGTDEIPDNSRFSDFRDPKVWERDGIFYCVVGVRDTDESGKIVMYRSNDLENWSYVGILEHSKHGLGRMWECPDVFELDSTDILIISPQEMHEDEFKYKNGNAAVYFLGTLDYETGKFTKVLVDEIDYGLDFYAPQTTLSPDGRRIMIAWMQSWDRNIPSDKYGWSCSMTLPRELRVINNKLIQIPVKEVENYRRNEVKYTDVIITKPMMLEGINGRCVELDITVDLTNALEFILSVIKAEDCETVISFDKKRSVLRFDRRQSQSENRTENTVDVREMPVFVKDNILKLRVFIDTFSVEIFAQDGEYTMTSTVYSKLDANSIEFEADGEVVLSLLKWDLVLS